MTITIVTSKCASYDDGSSSFAQNRNLIVSIKKMIGNVNNFICKNSMRWAGECTHCKRRFDLTKPIIKIILYT